MSNTRFLEQLNYVRPCLLRKTRFYFAMQYLEGFEGGFSTIECRNGNENE